MRDTAKVLTMDEARQVAKLPGLLKAKDTLAGHSEMGQATLFMYELPGPDGAPSEPFGTSDRTFKGVMRSSGG